MIQCCSDGQRLEAVHKSDIMRVERGSFMDQKVYELINDQINKELYSAYLYMDFANYYADEGLNGFANWYMIQAAEERDHALIFRKYLIDNSCKVVLGAIDQPDETYTDFTTPLEKALEHEKYVTALINDIYAAAHEVRDFRTMQFLDWFIQEQLEEESTADDMITNMKLFGTDAKGLYELDREYGARTYTIATPLAAGE